MPSLTLCSTTAIFCCHCQALIHHAATADLPLHLHFCLHLHFYCRLSAPGPLIVENYFLVDCCVPLLLNPALELATGSIGFAIPEALEAQPLAPFFPWLQAVEKNLRWIVTCPSTHSSGQGLGSWRSVEPEAPEAQPLAPSTFVSKQSKVILWQFAALLSFPCPELCSQRLKTIFR